MLSRRTLLVFTVILITALGGCERFKSAEDLYRDAQRLHQKGEYAAAVIQLKSALQINPSLFEARYLLGVSYNEIGNYADAEKELRAALLLRNDEPSARTALGRALLGQGGFSKAIEELNVPTNANTATAAELRALSGMAQLASGNRVIAAQDFAEALKAVPNQEDALLGQAQLAALDGQTDQALKLTDAVLHAAPRSKQAGLQKGGLLRLARRPAESVAAYQAVLSIDKTLVAAHVGLVSAYLEQRQTTAARQQIDSASKLIPNNLLLRYMQGQVSLQEKKYAEARDAALDVLKAAPDYIPANLLLGLASLALGSVEEASKNLAKVLVSAPSDEFARQILAQAQIAQRKPALALETVKPLLVANTQNANVLALAGEAYLQLGQHTKAIEYLQRAVQADPTNLNLRTGLGLTRLVGGQADQGVADLRAVASSEEAPSRADFALISALINQKRFDEAMKAIDVLAAKKPNDPAPHYLKGTVYAGKQQMDAARASFEQAVKTDTAYLPAAIALANLDMKNNDRASARKRFETVLSKDNDNLQGLLALAAFASQDKNEAESIKLLERAVKAHPAVLEPTAALAQMHLAMQKPQQALAIAQQFRRANPESNNALELLGSTQVAVGQTREAVTTYTQMAERMPDSPEAQYRLAQAHGVAGNAEGALKGLRLSLGLRPNYLLAETALVSLHVQRGQFEEALQIAQLAQKHHPQLAAGLIMQGNVEMAQKQFTRAIKSYEAARSFGLSGDLAIRTHQAYLGAGQRKQGDALFRNWLKDNPDDQAGRFYHAQTYMAHGEYKPAAELYETIIQKEPNNSLVLNNLAGVYHKIQDPRALATAERAYKLSPTAPIVADTLGWILVEQGNFVRGAEILEKAHASAKDQPEVTFHFAAALIKAGNKAKGQTLLAELVKSGKTFPQIEEAKRLLTN